LNVFSDRERQTLNVLKNARAINADADMILPSRAAINAAVAAVTAWGVADQAEPLGKRLTRAEIDQQLIDTGLDEKMKQQGAWEGWQNGAHGRKP